MTYEELKEALKTYVESCEKGKSEGIVDTNKALNEVTKEVLSEQEIKEYVQRMLEEIGKLL